MIVNSLDEVAGKWINAIDVTLEEAETAMADQTRYVLPWPLD